MSSLADRLVQKAVVAMAGTVFGIALLVRLTITNDREGVLTDFRAELVGITAVGRGETPFQAATAITPELAQRTTIWTQPDHWLVAHTYPALAFLDSSQWLRR